MTMENITGRDGYIEAQAFVSGIAFIQGLPPERRETSNMIDMCRIARVRYDHDMLAHFVVQAKLKTGLEVDLFPEGIGEIDEDPHGIIAGDFRTAVASMLAEVRCQIEASKSAAPAAENLCRMQEQRSKRDTAETKPARYANS